MCFSSLGPTPQLRHNPLLLDHKILSTSWPSLTLPLYSPLYKPAQVGSEKGLAQGHPNCWAEGQD